MMRFKIGDWQIDNKVLQCLLWCDNTLKRKERYLV